MATDNQSLERDAESSVRYSGTVLYKGITDKARCNPCSVARVLIRTCAVWDFRWVKDEIVIIQ